MQDKNIISKFVQWTKLKIRIHVTKKRKLYFKEREIWWAVLGANVGFEQDGKHEKFERPVLILKKFNRDVLWILPLTFKDKQGKYYYQFKYKNKKFSVILSQLRLISSKRLLRKIRTFPKSDFNQVKEKIKSFL